MPVLPAWLTDPLWDQFTALLPEPPQVDPAHPLGCHRARIGDRVVFDNLLQLLRFGCFYQAIADTICSATSIRDRRDEWISLGVFMRLRQLVLESCDRIVGLELDRIAVDGSITKAPGGGEIAGRSPVGLGKQGLKRSGMTDGYGIPLGRVLAGANRQDSPLFAATVDLLENLGPVPDDITVHLGAGYDSDKTRIELTARKPHGRIAHKGERAPIQASERWHVERTHAWQNTFHRIAPCYERRDPHTPQRPTCSRSWGAPSTTRPCPGPRCSGGRQPRSPASSPHPRAVPAQPGAGHRIPYCGAGRGRPSWDEAGEAVMSVLSVRP